MGRLLYGTLAREIVIDDRLLAHLEVAMLSKLRRREPFALTWQCENGDDGGRRHTVWVSSEIELEFVFDEARTPPLNRQWIEELLLAADRGNLQLRPEPVSGEPELVPTSS